MDEQALKQIAAQLRKPEGAEGIKTGEWMNKGNLCIHNDTLKILNASPNDTILELGMGNGYFVKEIVEKHTSIRYSGCDFSADMVSEATLKNQQWIAGGQVQFTCSNIAALPYPNETFNKIFTINTIYFWENERDVLNELNRVLQPGGKIIIALRPRREMEHYPFTKFGFKLFATEDVQKMLAENGFTPGEAFENKEPDFDMNGRMLKMENIIVTASK